MKVRRDGRKQSSAAGQIGQLSMPVKRAYRKREFRDVFGQSRKRPKMLRAGLYARVSSNDQQTLSKSSLHL
jgi:predicted site-specific integrase-resolvase